MRKTCQSFQVSTFKCRCHIPAVKPHETTQLSTDIQPTPDKSKPVRGINNPAQFSPKAPNTRPPSVTGCCFQDQSICIMLNDPVKKKIKTAGKLCEARKGLLLIIFSFFLHQKQANIDHRGAAQHQKKQTAPFRLW